MYASESESYFSRFGWPPIAELLRLQYTRESMRELLPFVCRIVVDWSGITGSVLEHVMDRGRCDK